LHDKGQIRLGAGAGSLITCWRPLHGIVRAGPSRGRADRVERRRSPMPCWPSCGWICWWRPSVGGERSAAGLAGP